MIAFLVLNHVRKNGKRDISSPGLGAIDAPAYINDKAFNLISCFSEYQKR